MTNISIEPELKSAAIAALPAYFNQTHRMAELLSDHPRSPSDHVAHYYANGNLSDVTARRTFSRGLRREGHGHE